MRRKEVEQFVNVGGTKVPIKARLQFPDGGSDKKVPAGLEKSKLFDGKRGPSATDEGPEAAD